MPLPELDTVYFDSCFPLRFHPAPDAATRHAAQLETGLALAVLAALAWRRTRAFDTAWLVRQLDARRKDLDEQQTAPGLPEHGLIHGHPLFPVHSCHPLKPRVLFSCLCSPALRTPRQNTSYSPAASLLYNAL